MNNSTVCTRSNNSVSMVGVLATQFLYSHSNHGKELHKAKLKVKRLSGVEDIINVVTDKRNLKRLDVKPGMTLRLKGVLRTHFQLAEYKCVELYVFADELNVVPCDTPHQNEVYIRAKMSMYHKPNLRVSPFGRQLTDFTLQQENRNNKHTFNFQCVAWNGLAKRITRFEPGTVLTVLGRLQSRNYEKQVDECKVVKIMTHEVSICRILESI